MDLDVGKHNITTVLPSKIIKLVITADRFLHKVVKINFNKYFGERIKICYKLVCWYQFQADLNWPLKIANIVLGLEF
jgi:hypothetical protein